MVAKAASIQKFDGMVAEAAVLRSWMDPGRNPAYHDQMQQIVRESMPLLGRALDRMAEERGHDKDRGHGSTRTSHCASVWEDEDGYQHMCVLDGGHKFKDGKGTGIHQCRCWARQRTAVNGNPIVPSPKGGECPLCGTNLEPGSPAYLIPGDTRYAHATCPPGARGGGEVSTEEAVRRGAQAVASTGVSIEDLSPPSLNPLSKVYAEQAARAQMCPRFEAMADRRHSNTCRICGGGRDQHRVEAR